MTYAFAERTASPGADLFVVFHGTGGNEHQFLGFARDLMPEAHVIAPRGDVLEGGALRYFRRRAEGVYDMEDLAARTSAMADFVHAHVERLQPRRVIGLGYSNGANILASVQFRNGALFDRTVLMHPLIPFSPDAQPALSGKRILITAGERDPLCPPDLTRKLEAFFRAQGAFAAIEWHAGGHDIRQNEMGAAKKFLQAA